MPDANDRLYLVDVNAVESDVEPLFNAFDDVVFRLFTRNNPTTPQAQIIRIYDTQQLANSFFNVNHPTRFHIHGIKYIIRYILPLHSVLTFLNLGWNGGGQNTGATIRNAYLNRGDNFNVYTVDWGLGATTPNYILARNRVNDAGMVVARFIDFLNVFGQSFNLIGLVGHSLVDMKQFLSDFENLY